MDTALLTSVTLTNEHVPTAPGSALSEQSVPVRMLLVDDSEVFRNVLSSVVAATPGFEVVGEASSGREALAAVASLDAQFVLMDVHMPEMDGTEAAVRIRREHPDVVIRLLTATGQAMHDTPMPGIEDKRDVSPSWLAQRWLADRA
jgi:CheY-like chemotaxis protein